MALLGLAFKPGTDDLRDSPAVAIARMLVTRGCFVTAYDPVVKALPAHPEVRIAPSALEAVSQADAIVLATDWPEFLNLDLDCLRTNTRGDLLFDGRNLFSAAEVWKAGFRYQAIGRC